jgi:hypothetical protein
MVVVLLTESARHGCSLSRVRSISSDMSSISSDMNQWQCQPPKHLPAIAALADSNIGTLQMYTAHTILWNTIQAVLRIPATLRSSERALLTSNIAAISNSLRLRYAAFKCSHCSPRLPPDSQQHAVPCHTHTGAHRLSSAAARLLLWSAVDCGHSLYITVQRSTRTSAPRCCVVQGQPPALRAARCAGTPTLRSAGPTALGIARSRGRTCCR